MSARPRRSTMVGAIRRSTTWTAAALLIALVSGCDFPGKPNPSDRPVSPESVLNFEAIYKRNCAGCHGPDGKTGPAPPLNDPLFRALIPEAELAHVVNVGRVGTPMPAFAIGNGGTLTPAQVQVLVRGMKANSRSSLSESKVAEARQPEKSSNSAPPWGDFKPLPKNVPAYLLSKHGSSHTSAQFEEIRKTVFTRACAGCHGEHGEGDSGAGAINDPSFLALMSDQGLRRIIITGRPDLSKPDSLAMPDYAGTDGRDSDFRPLTSREIDDLVDLLASWRSDARAENASRRQTTSQ